MSNKPKSSVTPINQHLQNKGNSNNPNDVIKAAKAAQEAKLEAAAKAEAEAKKAAPEAAKAEAEAPAKEEPKAPAKAEPEAELEEFKLESDADKKESDNDTDKPRKRLNRKQWIAILAKKEREGLTASQIAEEHGVSEGNVYQWASKLKAEADEESKAEEAAKLTPSSLVSDAIELMKGITTELEDFDAKIAEAKALVDNAAKERKVIEDSHKKYVTIVELLGSDEDKAKLKEVEAELKTK